MPLSIGILNNIRRATIRLKGLDHPMTKLSMYDACPFDGLRMRFRLGIINAEFASGCCNGVVMPFAVGILDDIRPSTPIRRIDLADDPSTTL